VRPEPRPLAADDSYWAHVPVGVFQFRAPTGARILVSVSHTTGEAGMENAYIAMVAGILVLLASMASVELALSVALVEIAFGVVAGNFLGLHATPWLDFLAGFASIVLTFLAGAEVDVPLMREKLKESLVIGGISFAAPFAGAWIFCQFVLGWPLQA